MRPLFLFLILINVLFFFWQTQWQQNFKTEITLQPEVLPAGVERLMLSRERPEPPQPKPQEELNSTEVVNATLDEEPATVASNIPPAKTVEQEVPKPELLPEVAGQPQEPVPPSPAVVAACFRLGPFTERSTAEEAAAAIRSPDILVEQRQQIERVRQAYWVYLPSAPNYKTASATADTLKSKGIKDLFIMGSGSYENAISLGLFRAETAAQQRLKQIQGLGFSPILTEQYRDIPQQWLLITVPAEQAAAVNAIQGIATSYPGLSLAQTACE